MAKQDQLKRVLESGVVAIIRVPDGSQLVGVAESLLAAGIQGIEVTFTVPQAHRVLEQVSSRLGDKIVLGAGTILDPETARTAILSGAEFLVTPTLNPAVITLARRYDKAIIPGAMTPTEILTAWEAGADMVKVFPSAVLGADYLKLVSGPLPQIPLIPTGGVNLENTPGFIKAGAVAVGVSAALVEPAAVAKGDFKRIETLARQYVEAVRQARAAK
jgi:2-dehydro-3-deoxyphosphogluconate aldolase/(4S)-4-hydroxy-2-oxoglutarate aldolase